MTAATILMLLLQASLFLVVLSFGLQIRMDDILYLFRRPWQLVKSLVSIFVVMLIFVIIVNRIFELRPVVEIALIALALSPVPPLIPNRLLKAGGSVSFSFGLLAAVSLLSLIIVPGVFRVMGSVFGLQANVSEGAVLKTILIGIVIPIVIGMLIRYFAPAAERFAGMLGKVGMIVAVLGLLPILITLLPFMWTVIGNGTIIAIIAFAVVGMIAGHLLGGPEPNDRTVLAIATSSRHPAIAIALASANAGEGDVKLVAAVVVLYALISVVVSIPYIKWFSGKSE
ncbi:MAG: Na+-dependent transporter [Acidobacteria bacterium]|nr:MAG: Na+-dependent transporter [Acidobacteriota bacterium]